MTHTNLIDPYKVLGIPHDASDQDIKRAYKKAALQHHPDRNVDKASSCETETKMALINEAYSILKDKDRKKEYDHWHRYGGGGGVPVCDYDNDYIPSTQEPQNSSVHGYSSRCQKNDSSFRNDDDDEKEEEEMHFQTNPGLNPFLFINVPRTNSKGTKTSSSNTSSSFTFAFSSMSTQYAKDGKSKIYTRKYTQYNDGWKHTQIETATVDEFGHTIYKRSMTHEKTKLQNLRDLVSSFLKQNPMSLPKAKGNTRGDPSNSSYSPQAYAETATSSSNNHNHNNEATNGGWVHQVMSQVRKCTGTCGGLLSLSDYSS